MRKHVWMMLAVGLLSALMIVPGARFPAKADESENESLSACEHYANQWIQSQNPAEERGIHLLPTHFLEEKYEAKVGRQFISTVLTGNGILQKPDQSSSTPFRFTCLLEDWKTPVFFHMTDNAAPSEPARDPAQQCWDQFHPAGWGALTDCLENALNREQAKLKEAELATVRRAAHSMERAAAEEALDVSSDFWMQYRDSECQRRQAQMAGANHPDIGELICRIQKTQQRVLDLHFDD